MANFFSCLVLITLLLPSCHILADPPPLHDFCIAKQNSNRYVDGYPCKFPSEVTSDDFAFDGFTDDNKVFNILWVNFTYGTVVEFPGLNTLGMSVAQTTMLPGPVVPPHLHPRATELHLVIDGRVVVGFVSSESKLYYKILTPKMVFVVPQGLEHWILNVGLGPAIVYTALNSQSPGLLITPLSLFNSTPSIPDYLLSRSFRVKEPIVQLLKSRLSVPLVH